ncbi:MAG: FkbM family methyltransferase [Bryobacterales bacterium]|nr:FkbM family methyltransferase [Bryobacterales bacterium]
MLVKSAPDRRQWPIGLHEPPQSRYFLPTPTRQGRFTNSRAYSSPFRQSQNMFNRARYRLLRRLPGSRGRRYSRKFNAFLALDEFERAIRHTAGKTCIDLGANIGHYTQQLAKFASDVIAFEPDPWTFARLQSNLSNFSNVKIENAAAGIKEGTVLLWRHSRFNDDPDKYSTSSSVISDKFNILDHNQAIEVRQINFINYLFDLDKEVGIIKIDIEGAELDLLEALLERPDLLSRIDYIFCETHERQIPDHAPRVHNLRARTDRLTHPRFNLDWH